MKHLINPYFGNPADPITICVAGCGGTGSQVINQLARVNYTLRKLNHPGLIITCYDDDKVTEANCGRQLFAESEIGAYKAEVIVSRVNRFYGTGWKFEPFKYDGTNEKFNITISCTDSIASRVLIEKNIVKFRIKKKDETREDYRKQHYWIDCGNSYDYGQVVLGTCYNSSYGEELGYKWWLKNIIELYPEFKDKPESNESSCSLAEAIAKQDLFINTIIAEYCANMVWKLCTATDIEHQGVFVNLKNYQTRPIPIT